MGEKIVFDNRILFDYRPLEQFFEYSSISQSFIVACTSKIMCVDPLPGWFPEYRTRYTAVMTSSETTAIIMEKD